MKCPKGLKSVWPLEGAGPGGWPTSGIDAINRATEIMSFYLNKESTQRADVLIEPAVKQLAWTDFLKYEEIIHEGEKAAESAIEEIGMMLNPCLKRRLIQRVREFVHWNRREEDVGNLPLSAPDLV